MALKTAPEYYGLIYNVAPVPLRHWMVLSKTRLIEVMDVAIEAARETQYPNLDALVAATFDEDDAYDMMEAIGAAGSTVASHLQNSIDVQVGEHKNIGFTDWVEASGSRTDADDDIFYSLLITYPRTATVKASASMDFAKALLAEPAVRAFKAAAVRTIVRSPLLAAYVKASFASHEDTPAAMAVNYDYDLTDAIEAHANYNEDTKIEHGADVDPFDYINEFPITAVYFDSYVRADKIATEVRGTVVTARRVLAVTISPPEVAYYWDASFPELD